jgi:alpha-mannosidase
MTGFGCLRTDSPSRSLPVKSAHKTNLLEDDLEEVTVHDGLMNISCRPFEIITLRLQL